MPAIAPMPAGQRPAASIGRIRVVPLAFAWVATVRRRVCRRREGRQLWQIAPRRTHARIGPLRRGLPPAPRQRPSVGRSNTRTKSPHAPRRGRRSRLMRSNPRKAVLFLAARRALTPLRFGHESETTPSSSAGARRPGNLDLGPRVCGRMPPCSSRAGQWKDSPGRGLRQRRHRKDHKGLDRGLNAWMLQPFRDDLGDLDAAMGLRT